VLSRMTYWSDGDTVGLNRRPGRGCIRRACLILVAAWCHGATLLDAGYASGSRVLASPSWLTRAVPLPDITSVFIGCAPTTKGVTHRRMTVEDLFQRNSTEWRGYF
jgi:hypothetical protein